VGGAQADGKSNQPQDAQRPDPRRYRWQNGRWWYWTKQNTWLYWSEPQGWLAYQAPVVQQMAPATRAPVRARGDYSGDSWRWGWDPANPFNRYPPGRPINSPKMFPKNM
jgi:hypothetical protein